MCLIPCIHSATVFRGFSTDVGDCRSGDSEIQITITYSTPESTVYTSTALQRCARCFGIRMVVVGSSIDSICPR